MSAEDLEKYETEMELTLYREYRDVVGIFKYVVRPTAVLPVQPGRRQGPHEAGDVFFEVSISDAWVWDMYRPARFAKNVKVLTFKDVNVEELSPRRSTCPRPDLPGVTGRGWQLRAARGIGAASRVCPDVEAAGVAVAVLDRRRRRSAALVTRRAAVAGQL